MRMCAVLMIVALFLVSGSDADAKQHTIMIYMNGSDLESEIGAATTDLVEILESGLKSKRANVVIFTGGTYRWQNDVIPAYECALWHVEDGELFEIKRLGQLSMGDPDTLADFITFGMENFPAKKYGLILWDHGGGAIAGFGHDEIFLEYDGGNLTLPEMDYAFRKAGLSGQKLEWLGFDSCLMATVEMALISSQYAKYLVASEDLEPGDGWDYKFLSILNRFPRADGYVIGKEIVDTFMDFYGPDSYEILTLSVVDLNRVYPVMDAMGQLMEQCSGKIMGVKGAGSLKGTGSLEGFGSEHQGFDLLAERRRYTKTFGEGSARDNYNDMVDIGDMAHQLADLFPKEAAKIHDALRYAVLYNRHNSLVPVYGLSSYYVYGGLFYEALDMYAQLNVDDLYTGYLIKFFDRLSYRKIEPNAPTRANIMGAPAYLYRTNQLQGRTLYAVPAQVNGTDCDIIVCEKHDKYGEYEVLGYRHMEGLIKQKGYNFLGPEDRIAFYYPA